MEAGYSVKVGNTIDSPYYVDGGDAKTVGYDAFMKEATRKPGQQSAFMQALGNRAAVDKSMQEGQMRNRAASDNAAAMANLSERGGAGSGAAERMARSGNANLLQQTGQANGLFNKAIAEGQMKDESNRVGMLSAAPGAELARAENAQNKAVNRNAYNLKMFDIGSQAYGAEKSAQSTEAAAKDEGGTWLCTLNARFVDPCDMAAYKTSLKLIKKHAFVKMPEVVSFYLDKGVILAGRMAEKSEALEKELIFIKEVIRLFDNGNDDTAINLYFDRTKELFEKYCPEIKLPEVK